MTEEAAAQAGTEQTQTADTTATTQPAANQSWYDGLPEEDRTHLTSKGWNDPDPGKVLPKVYKSAREAERMISTIKASPDRIIVAPKDFNNPEEVSAYYEKIGVPKDVDGYELGEMDDILKGVAEIGLKSGVPKTALKSVVDGYRTLREQAQAKADALFTEQATKELETYKASLGAELNAETKFFAAGKQAFPQLAEKAAELEKALGVRGYIEHMAKLGRLVGEDTALGIGSADATQLRNSEMQLAQFKMDESKMAILGNTTHPQHQATLAEWNRLHKAMYD